MGIKEKPLENDPKKMKNATLRFLGSFVIIQVKIKQKKTIIGTRYRI